ncbi:MAG TPA: DUF192 domain-containing protein [Terriglobales bacterium]|nr:DUF192 domain-containing protein [Terriglobales bacterium]
MFGKQRHVFVYNKTRETFLAFRVAVADSVLGRLVGLLGRRSLPQDSGVWIVPSNAVHTIGMLFSFDLVLIDKNFKVVGLRELVRPFTITWPNHRAESVLELPAHSIFRSRTQIGDQLLIERYEAKKPPKSGQPEQITSPNPDRANLNVALAGSHQSIAVGPENAAQRELPRSSYVDQ